MLSFWQLLRLVPPLEARLERVCSIWVALKWTKDVQRPLYALDHIGRRMPKIRSGLTIISTDSPVRCHSSTLDAAIAILKLASLM